MTTCVDVLDHGFVRLVGDDLSGFTELLGMGRT